MISGYLCFVLYVVVQSSFSFMLPGFTFRADTVYSGSKALRVVELSRDNVFEIEIQLLLSNYPQKRAMSGPIPGAQMTSLVKEKVELKSFQITQQWPLGSTNKT